MSEFIYIFPNNNIDVGERRMRINNSGQWVEYTGVDEQIAEIHNTKNGYVLRKDDGRDVLIVNTKYQATLLDTTHYWIIPGDPLREMKIRWAQTGQPVWVKISREQFFDNIYRGKLGDEANVKLDDSLNVVIETTTPDWNIPNAEYSFTPFKEDK